MLVPSSSFLAFALLLLAPAPETPTAPTEPAEAPRAAPEAESKEPTGRRLPALNQETEIANAPGTKLVTLPEAIQIALEQRPRLKAAQHDIEAERIGIDEAKSGYFPQIGGSVQYVRATENGNTVSFHSVPGLSRVGGSRRAGVRGLDSFNNFLVGVALQQQIWDFGRTKSAMDQRKAAVMVVEAARVQTEQQITFEVARAYYDVLAARESVAVAKDILSTGQYIFELAEASQKAGLKPASESTRAQANIATAEVRLVRAEGALEAALAGFAGSLGDARGRYAPAKAEIAAPLPAEDDAITAALSQRPELAILDAGRKGLDASLEQAKSQQRPRIDALAGVHTRGQLMPRPANVPTFADLNMNIGVVLSVPIFQGLRIRRQKQQLETRMASVAETRDEVSQAVIVEVRQAMASAKAADRAVVAAQSGVEAAEIALTTLSGRYSEGLTRLVDLTDAQSTYVASRLQLVAANFDRLVSRAALQLAMGETPAGE